jgi:hypothetical protein
MLSFCAVSVVVLEVLDDITFRAGDCFMFDVIIFQCRENFSLPQPHHNATLPVPQPFSELFWVSNIDWDLAFYFTPIV